jgi:hypothetical protein
MLVAGEGNSVGVRSVQWLAMLIKGDDGVNHLFFRLCVTAQHNTRGAVEVAVFKVLSRAVALAGGHLTCIDLL